MARDEMVRQMSDRQAAAHEQQALLRYRADRLAAVAPGDERFARTLARVNAYNDASLDARIASVNARVAALGGGDPSTGQAPAEGTKSGKHCQT